ncbi:hypothetical protein QYE76_067261 [Lolium multiflorum]|uniref:Retrotransposon gag domain-containing protein n=1 Tax=Lolium multiflorum TaxID=4521 RepID=A0AAD8WAL0_LOLMU|nr:hypothetical protein QYE76_067261 [Lolium multiflorum]
MQCLQLYLKDSARAWLRGLPKGSIKSWDDLVDAFVANFQATYKRPVGIKELQHCQQKPKESMRAYVGRFTKLLNAAEDVSVDRAIDAFSDGIRRETCIEELGRKKPKTITKLMEIANSWADGEDNVQRPRQRSDDEDDDQPKNDSGGRRDRRKKRKDRSTTTTTWRDDRQDGNRSNSGNRSNYKPRPQRTPELPFAEQINAPCYLHAYIDSKDNKKKSSHLLRDCRQFIEMQKLIQQQQQPPPPPPPPQHQVQQVQPHNPNESFPPPRGQMSMIHRTGVSRREMKKLTQEINLAESIMANIPEYIDWSSQSITFSRADHPMTIPKPGHAALVVEAQIGGFKMSKVFMDGGSGLNLIFLDTIKTMGITMRMLEETDTCFHGILPTSPAYSIGKVYLNVVTTRKVAMADEVEVAPNPSKEIFSELDEIFAQGPIFARSFQKTEEGRKWGHEAPTIAPSPGRADLGVGPSCGPPRPSAYLKPPSRKPQYREPRYGKPSRDAAANPISEDSGDRLRTLPERGFISGGLFIAMIASGVMSE